MASHDDLDDETGGWVGDGPLELPEIDCGLPELHIDLEELGIDALPHLADTPTLHGE